MKIYTKKGDAGQTGLYRGGKVSKDVQRVTAYGTVDELSSQIGFVRTFSLAYKIDKLLHRIQNDLFVIGADLATPPSAVKKGDKVTRLPKDSELFLEEAIDAMEEELPPLENFILPSGTQTAAAIHVARSVCRRAEREAVTLAKEEEIGSPILKYLNRLSDFLFVLARWKNQQEGSGDVLWEKEG